jgi:hypothetical protein
MDLEGSFAHSRVVVRYTTEKINSVNIGGRNMAKLYSQLILDLKGPPMVRMR